jgi:hypothetical protein
VAGGVPAVISAVNATAPGSRPRGPIALAVSTVKPAKYSPALMTSSPARTGILIV